MSYRAGFVGLIGLPNSGKSTLMNALVGEKVSIVTSKPQTTRRRMVGLLNVEGGQLVFVDAPGVVPSKTGLNAFLRSEAEDVITQSDVLIAVLNIDERRAENLDEIIKIVQDSKKPWIALIHKTDLPQLHRPQILRDKLKSLNARIVQGSSLEDAKVLKEILVEALVPLLPESAGALYDKDLYTLSSMRDLCAEVIREKCFENLHEELPFGTAVRIVKFDETEGQVVKIFAEVIVGKDNHRPMVIGRAGQVLKNIGTYARKEIESLVGRKVYLDLRVVTKINWQKNPMIMKEFGYVHEAEQRGQ